MHIVILTDVLFENNHRCIAKAFVFEILCHRYVCHRNIDRACLLQPQRAQQGPCREQRHCPGLAQCSAAVIALSRSKRTLQSPRLQQPQSARQGPCREQHRSWAATRVSILNLNLSPARARPGAAGPCHAVFRPALNPSTCCQSPHHADPATIPGTMPARAVRGAASPSPPLHQHA